jgi:hypothetical protein
MTNQWLLTHFVDLASMSKSGFLVAKIYIKTKNIKSVFFAFFKNIFALVIVLPVAIYVLTTTVFSSLLTYYTRRKLQISMRLRAKTIAPNYRKILSIWIWIFYRQELRRYFFQRYVGIFNYSIPNFSCIISVQ